MMRFLSQIYMWNSEKSLPSALVVLSMRVDANQYDANTT